MSFAQNPAAESQEPAAPLSPSSMERSAAAPLPPPPAAQPPSFALAARLLRMADRYREQYAICQATEIYFKLVDEFDDTPSAALAQERLLEIGEHYERNGEFRLARGIYERLSE